MCPPRGLSPTTRRRTLPVCRCPNPILKTKEGKPLFEVVTGGTRRGESAIDVLRAWPFALVDLVLELRPMADATVCLLCVNEGREKPGRFR